MDVRTPSGLVELLRAVRRLAGSPPAVVHSWGHAANTVSSFLVPFLRAKYVWSLHDSGPVSVPIKVLVRMNALAANSSSVDAIITVAHSTEAYYRALFYPSRKFHYITNGIDLGEYYPDPPTGQALRSLLGIAFDTPVVGMAGRWSFEKGFDIFVHAAERLLVRIPSARFLLCGPGVHSGNAKLKALVDASGQPERFFLLGNRREMRPFYNAIDLLASCSVALESFGLAVVEAMACGVLPVVGDTGDLRISVGNFGEVVPRLTPEAVADAWYGALTPFRAGLPERRDRLQAHVREHFALEKMVKAYETVYAEPRARAPRRVNRKD